MYSLNPSVSNSGAQSGRVIQFSDGVAQQDQNEVKGFAPGGVLLPWHTPHEPTPFTQVEHHDSTTSSSHGSLSRDSRLSSLSGQAPSLIRHSCNGLLCHAMWLSQL